MHHRNCDLEPDTPLRIVLLNRTSDLSKCAEASCPHASLNPTQIMLNSAVFMVWQVRCMVSTAHANSMPVIDTKIHAADR